MKQKKRNYFYGRTVSDETKKKEHRGEGTGAEYRPWIRARSLTAIKVALQLLSIHTISAMYIFLALEKLWHGTFYDMTNQ